MKQMPLKSSGYQIILLLLYIYISVANHIQRKCFDESNPIGLYYNFTYELIFIIKGDVVELECRTCNGSYPTPSPYVIVTWASISLKPLVITPHIKAFKTKSKKFKKQMMVLENSTLLIRESKPKHTGLYSCNITTTYSDNTTSSQFINYFMEVITSKTDIMLGSLTNWLEYRDEVLDQIDYKLCDEGLDGQEGRLKIYWGPWGYCLCGAHQFDARKFRTAYPYVWINESQSNQPIFPAWSKKFKKNYPYFANITQNATIFKQYTRCTDVCVPDILEEDVQSKYTEIVYIKESESAEFICPDTGNESEVMWILNNEVLLNKTENALGTGEEENHVGVDTLAILHLNDVKQRNAGLYSCLVDGFPMKSIEVTVIPKFVLFTEEGQNALHSIGMVLLFCFILWTVILILKACFMMLTSTGENDGRK